MKLTPWDVIAKSDRFDAAAARLELARWKWHVLDAVDGITNIGDLAASQGIDADSVIGFAEDAIAEGVVRVVLLSHAQFYGTAAGVDEPVALQPEPEPEPEVKPVWPAPVAEVWAPVAETPPEPIVAEEPVVAEVLPEPPQIEAPPEPAVAQEPEPAVAEEPEPVVAEAPPEAVAPPEPAAVPPIAAAVAAPNVAPPSAAGGSFADRVAALRAKALKMLEKPAPEAYASVTSPEPVEAVEFTIGAEAKVVPPRSADEIEFTV